MFSKCKVTVVKKGLNQDVIDEYLEQPEGFKICSKVADNQEFIIDNPYEMPTGMCPKAWTDIRIYIIAIASGGKFPLMKVTHSTLASCSDFFRPVIFKIERI